MNQPLRCLVCGMQPDHIIKDKPGYQPLGATMFSAGAGHYGSIWDTMSSYRSLEINVCDACLVAHKDRVAVMLTEPRPPRPEPQFIAWEPFVEDD